ncbi:nonstructural polyprotein [Drosophila kikkawai virus 1]|nr:nonstructural polyprotein [Drosophila kikkawai virus 1]
MLKIPNLMTTNAPLSLETLCKHTIRLKKEFKEDDLDVQQLVKLGILKQKEVDKIICFKVWDATRPIVLKYRFVEPLKRSYTFSAPTMILAQYIIDQKEAKHMFRYWLCHYMRLYPFDNRKFWRNLLLKFEGSRYWFSIFWELYQDCIFEEGECRSFRNYCHLKYERNTITSMKIEVTAPWYDYLTKIGFDQLYVQAYHEKHTFVNTLIQCGDVELNPGPVMSRFMRYNNSSMNKKHEAQGLIDETKRLNDFLTTQLPQVIENVKMMINEHTINFNNSALFIDEKIKEDLKIFSDNSENHLNKLQNMQSNVLKTLVILSLIGIMVKCKWYKSATFVSLLTLLSLFGIPAKLVEQIQKLFKVEHEAEVFSNSNALGTLVGSIICFLIIGKLPTDSSIEKFSKKANNISRGLSGMMNIHKDIGKLWSQVKEFVMSQINPTPEGFITMEEEMLQWMKDIEHYVDIIVKRKATIVNEQIIKISNLLKQGLRLRSWAFSNKCSPEVCRNISNYIRTAEQLYNYADKNNTLDGGQRQRPLCIVLFGESQIGKSGLIYPLAQDLCYAAGYRKASDIDEQIYARQPETEFWDGYKGQFIVVRDDCLAAIDDVSNPNPELHETIREMNDFPYHLHMAALEDKNSFYTSKVGIMTINDINAPIKSLTYPEAFYNRISDNMYQVQPAPKFAKKLQLGAGNVKTLLDLDKVREYLDELSKEAGYRVPITTDIYNFVKYRKLIVSGKTQFQPDPEAKILNYTEFSQLMCKQLSQKKDDFNVKKEFMEKRLLHMQAQVNAEVEEFFECYSEIADIISKRVLEGESLMDIECDLLQSDRADDYLAFKQGAQEYCSQPRMKIKYYSEQMFEQASSCIKKWFDAFRQGVETVLNKYPALKYVLAIGTIAVAMYSLYSAVFKEKTIEHFVIEDEIDEETYQNNQRWIQQQKLSFNDRMSYWKTNLMMAYPEERDNIDKNVDGVKFFSEGMDSPSSGKQKHMPKHRIEGIQSPSNGKTNKLAKHRIESKIHESEGTVDCNAMETAFSVMRNNLYTISYTNAKGDNKVLGNAMALQGFNYLIPYHFIRYLILNDAPLTTELHLSRVNYSEKVYNDMTTFKFSELINEDHTLNRAIQLAYGEHKLDAVIFNTSENSNAFLHRSILKHFILKEELGRLRGNMQGLLLSYHNDNGQIAKVVKSLNDVHNYEQELKISVEDESYIHRAGYLYNGDTMKGDCGGPLIIKSNSLLRKIVGMHISGATGEGYSAKLYQELLQDHIDLLSKKLGEEHRVQCYLHIDESILVDNNCNLPNGVFTEIGTLKIPLHQASRTVLKPSIIHGMLSEPITKPAYLKPFEKDGKLIDPAYKGLEKCGGVTPLIDTQICSMAQNYVKQKLYVDHKNIGFADYARVLTYEEAIMGTEDIYMSAVCRSTSPGYPFNSDPQFKTSKPGKQQWMGNNDQFDFTSASALQLRNIVEELEANCKKGIITGVICADTMKDERRPILKVEDGKTRMFSACPMHFVVLFRKYYLGYAAFLMHNRNLNGVAVGTNPYNEDWDQIVRQISKKGKKVLAGDFSNYDGSLNTQVLWMVYETIEEFYKRNDVNYNANDAKVRYSLWLHIVNSVHVYGNNLYQWTHSQPSGNPFTVIINSIYNLLILVIAYLTTIKNSNLEYKQKAKLFNTISFDRHVSPIVYGDDNILNISDDICELFNQQTLTDSLEMLGHTYTEETKDGKIHKYRNIHDISFLKRKFVFDEDTYHWIAPLDISVIYEMLNWVRGNSVDSVSLLKSNIETALREVSLHGVNEFNKFVKALQTNHVINKKVHPFIPTYAEVRCAIEHMDPMSGFSA